MTDGRADYPAITEREASVAPNAMIRGAAAPRALVEGGARIELDGQRVRVDYRVFRSSSEAAVEILGGRSRAGAAQSIDHAVTNFHVLRRGLYRGLLVGVYDENSPAAATDLREQFLAARPEETLLLPGSEAIPTLTEWIVA